VIVVKGVINLKSALIFLSVISIVCIILAYWSRRSDFDVNELDFLAVDVVEEIVNNEIEEE